MTKIKAIETEYKGYRFRSRLEARWAVFFDEMGIKYEYEDEGYRTEDEGTKEQSKYLADFLLPEFRCLFEVKRKGVLNCGLPTDDWKKSADWKKILSTTEAVKLHNKELPFDYIVLASGSPYDCLISTEDDCGLVFNGIVGMLKYFDNEGKRKPEIYPLTEKAGLPVWGHLPVCFEYLSVPNNENGIVFFGKRWYDDFSRSKGKSEIVPIGQRCASIASIMNGVIPRYRGIQLFEPGDYVALDVQKDKNSPIYSACIKARQARFEYGETPG